MIDPRKVYGELGSHLRGVEARARNEKYNPAPVPEAAPEPMLGLEMEAMDLGAEMDALGDEDVTALLGAPDPDPAVEPASPEVMADQGVAEVEGAALEGDLDEDIGMLAEMDDLE